MATSSSKTTALLNFLDFNCLCQKNKILNLNDRLLDLIITSDSIDATVSRKIDPVVDEDSHHPCLEFEILVREHREVRFKTDNTSLKYQFPKADFPGMYAAFQNIDWSDI
ncbi:hypothetical protein Zmor_006272 [Zophobas morio]|uniref:Uncharacterized protein n=1 Tax=Zophobas morio TaxID=2755281 RepID=A0AA38MMP4_9CUCU|nr:hypothetical protein Zmor_006272 [Zophobas morio]